MKKALIVVLLAAAFAAGGWWWWTGRAASDPNTLVLHGNVDIRQVSLAFDGTGRIVELDAEEGDKVAAGQVVGRLDTRTLALQSSQAAAQVEVQKQTLLRLKNGARPEEIAEAEALLALAGATAARADGDYARARQLQAAASGAISAQSLDRARSDAEAARAQVEQARAALRLAEAGPRSEDIAAAAAQLAASEASLAVLRHQIDLGTLRAPVDAVVRSRLLEPGDMATPQRPVLALALTQPKWARVYVGEPDLGKIRPGMAAEILTDSGAGGGPGGARTGKVGYISSVAEFTPKAVQTDELRTSLVYEVRIIVEDRDDRLRLGQPVTARLSVGAGP